MMATMNDHLEVVALLLRHGADPNRRNEFSHSVLHRISSGTSRELVQLLVDAGADVNARERHGWTPLHLAITGNNPAAVEVLLAAGADPHAADRQGVTPMQSARSEGSTEVLQAFLKHTTTEKDSFDHQRVGSVAYGDLSRIKAAADACPEACSLPRRALSARCERAQAPVNARPAVPDAKHPAAARPRLTEAAQLPRFPQKIFVIGSPP